MRRSLHCAAHDETENGFGGDDGFVGMRSRTTAETGITADPFGDGHTKNKE
jgi:hypothetical protein